jgi:hypothetical protein
MVDNVAKAPGLGAGGYGIWAVCAMVLGLASDLAQPLGAVAVIILFIFGVAALSAGLLSLLAPIRVAMRHTALFCLIGGVVFGAIVVFQYVGPREEISAKRGFVAAAIPAVAAFQDDVFGGVRPSESNNNSAEAPTAPQAEVNHAPTAPLPVAEIGVFRSGPLAVRVESASLSFTEAGSYFYNILATATLSLHNTGDSPISITLMQRPTISLALDNGLTLDPDGWNEVGLQTCYRDPCDSPDYSQIPPNSFIVANVAFREQVNRDQGATLPRVRTASLSGRLNLIEGQGRLRYVQMGMANFPISNGAAQTEPD